MVRRRRVVIALGAGALVAPLVLLAQQQTKVYRIGFLGAASAAGYAKRLEAFRAGLHELGYVEGKNLVFEFRWAEGNYEQLPELAAELIRLKVDLIVATGSQAALPAMRATTTIPIVAPNTGDPVATGLVTNLAHPGGNVTGTAFFQPEVNAKRLELLKEALPRIKRVRVLLNTDNALNGATIRAMEATAKSLKLEFRSVTVRGPLDFVNAFSRMVNERVDAVAISEDPMIIANVKTIVDIASKRGLLLVGFGEVADAGGLIGYGVNALEMWRNSATLVDKILKGTKAGDLPVEQATRFDMIVNMKTAKALGLKIPGSIMVRATKVIE